MNFETILILEDFFHLSGMFLFPLLCFLLSNEKSYSSLRFFNKRSIPSHGGGIAWHDLAWHRTECMVNLFDVDASYH